MVRFSKLKFIFGFLFLGLDFWVWIFRIDFLFWLSIFGFYFFSF